METIVKALGPAFAAGFAVQQFLELLDLLLVRLKMTKKTKKIMCGVISLVVGFFICLFISDMRVLKPLFEASGHSIAKGIDALDLIITSFIISAGTEGFNAIVKFLDYSKDKQKSDSEKK